MEPGITEDEARRQYDMWLRHAEDEERKRDEAAAKATNSRTIADSIRSMFPGIATTVDGTSATGLVHANGHDARVGGNRDGKRPEGMSEVHGELTKAVTRVLASDDQRWFTAGEVGEEMARHGSAAAGKPNGTLRYALNRAVVLGLAEVNQRDGRTKEFRARVESMDYADLDIVTAMSGGPNSNVIPDDHDGAFVGTTTQAPRRGTLADFWNQTKEDDE